MLMTKHKQERTKNYRALYKASVSYIYKLTSDNVAYLLHAINNHINCNETLRDLQSFYITLQIMNGIT